MLTITDETTIVQLSIELAKRGVEYTRSEIVCGAPRPFLFTIGRLVPTPFESTGTGTTYAEAVDDALARFTQRMARIDLSARMGSN